MKAKVKELFGKEMQLMPVEWNFGAAYFPTVNLVFQRAIGNKQDFTDLKDFYEKLKRAFLRVNLPLEEIEDLSSNILKFSQQQVNQIFGEALFQECKKINLLDYKISNGDYWIYIHAYKDIVIPEDLFAHDGAELHIKEHYETYLKNLEAFQKRVEEGYRGTDTEEVNEIELGFCSFLAEMLAHPTLSSKIPNKKLQTRIAAIRQDLQSKEIDTTEILEEITEILGRVIKDDSVFDFWF